MLIGYMRPVQEDSNCQFQKEKLQQQNCEKLFIEEHSSAKKRVRLKSMIKDLNKDDKIIVARLYILADSTRHLVEILDLVQEKGAYLQSLYENIDTSNHEGYQFIDIVKCLLEFQSDVISERTKKGLDDARKRGVNTGRPRKPDENVQRAIEMYQSKKYSLSEIRETTGISKSTLYRYLES
ncbi:recombinase family protein [Lederbergia citri]|uniref:Recombinase family protein n=1 Tax=Lederbergia citri TaxID=2833580 RepID=A0A942YHJ7_9BACI|nr:recombinase family protein [Lederbergia citri]MBS4196652.1 recombinase family protein [Lederbergia citri]